MHFNLVMSVYILAEQFKGDTIISLENNKINY